MYGPLNIEPRADISHHFSIISTRIRKGPFGFGCICHLCSALHVVINDTCSMKNWLKRRMFCGLHIYGESLMYYLSAGERERIPNEHGRGWRLRKEAEDGG